MKKLGLILLALSAISQGGSPAKERNWQEGMLLNPENNVYFRSVEKTEQTGGVQTGLVHATNTNGDVQKPALSVRDNYVLTTSDGAYLVERQRLSSVPAASLFITMQVKFFVEKDKLYMVDRDGKEVATKIVKRARKDSATANGQ